jgi:fluoride exporter
VILALVVGLAGAAGAALRYGADIAISARFGSSFPLGTVSVNVAGSFVLGVLTGLLWFHGLGVHVDDVLGVGFCGGLTTWSTASWESVRLLEAGLHRQAFFHALGGLVGAIAAAALGAALAAL